MAQHDRPLTHPSRGRVDPWTWETLVGPGWDAYVRVLHPAARFTGEADQLALVRWRNVAPAGVDVATAIWFDTSGVRLHASRTGTGWDLEPHVGPGDLFVHPYLLRHLFSGAAATVWAGRWDGYGHRPPQPPRPLARELTLWGGMRTYAVTTLDVALREELITAPAQSPGYPRTGSRMYPDIAWDEAATFSLATDTDLPSTIIGCTAELAQRICADTRLEAVIVDPTARAEA